MELTHRFVVPSSVEVTWAAFNDLEGIAPCFPGATLTSVEGDEFTGSVKIRLGPISMVYSGSGTFVERDDTAHRAVISAKGKDKRGNGTAGATVVAQLTPEGTGTAVEVSTDLSITGKPAQFGRGVIQDVSDKLLGQFVDCIAARLAPGGAAAGPVTGAVPDSAGVGEDIPVDPSPAARTPPVQTPPPAQPPSGESETPGVPSSPAEPASPAEPTTPARHAEPAQPAKPAELNLLSTVMPVLLRRYAVPAVIAVVVVVVIIWLIAR